MRRIMAACAAMLAMAGAARAEVVQLSCSDARMVLLARFGDEPPHVMDEGIGALSPAPLVVDFDSGVVLLEGRQYEMTATDGLIAADMPFDGGVAWGGFEAGVGEGPPAQVKSRDDVRPAPAEAPQAAEAAAAPASHGGGALFIDRRSGVLTYVLMMDTDGVSVRGQLTAQCRTADGATAF